MILSPRRLQHQIESLIHGSGSVRSIGSTPKSRRCAQDFRVLDGELISLQDTHPFVCDHTRALTAFSRRTFFASVLQTVRNPRDNNSKICACQDA